MRRLPLLASPRGLHFLLHAELQHNSDSQLDLHPRIAGLQAYMWCGVMALAQLSRTGARASGDTNERRVAVLPHAWRLGMGEPRCERPVTTHGVQRSSMPRGWAWATWVDPLAYAVQALIANEFAAPRWAVPYEFADPGSTTDRSAGRAVSVRLAAAAPAGL